MLVIWDIADVSSCLRLTLFSAQVLCSQYWKLCFSGTSAVVFCSALFFFFFELFQLNSSSFACGQNRPSVNISTPNTHLGMLQITNRGYYEARGGREWSLSSTHAVKLNHLIEKDPVRESTRDGACDTAAWWSDEEEVFDFGFGSLHQFWIFYLNTTL